MIEHNNRALRCHDPCPPGCAERQAWCNGTKWSIYEFAKGMRMPDWLDRGLRTFVETKRTLAMQCANPLCSKELLYLREGRIELLELESHADHPFRPDDGAFAMNCLPSKFFWLCGECAKTLIVKRWTTSGLVLVRRNQSAAGGHTSSRIK
jgi:hypothetical protein